MPFTLMHVLPSLCARRRSDRAPRHDVEGLEEHVDVCRPILASALRSGASFDWSTASLSRRCSGATDTIVRGGRVVLVALDQAGLGQLGDEEARCADGDADAAASSETVRGPSRVTTTNATM